MKKLAKFIALLLTAVTLCVSVLPLFAGAEAAPSPRYANTNTCNCYFSASTGEALATVTYNGKSAAFSYATVTVKIQKRFLGIFWSHVEEWTAISEKVNGYIENSTVLEKTGTYRAVFTVKIYGKDGSVDTIEDTITSTYD